ncbi:hypothetical protein C8R43DRAFT_967477 [Mycena crocata]|nr:hypothetical protein C8R43DRAFT_967477 [Mycena crocata]
MSARSRSGPQSFFSGCSNVHISGGTFNDIAGDLNQYFSYSHQVAVQYNRHNSSMSSVVSPSTMGDKKGSGERFVDSDASGSHWPDPCLRLGIQGTILALECRHICVVQHNLHPPGRLSHLPESRDAGTCRPHITQIHPYPRRHPAVALAIRQPQITSRDRGIIFSAALAIAGPILPRGVRPPPRPLTETPNRLSKMCCQMKTRKMSKGNPMMRYPTRPFVLITRVEGRRNSQLEQSKSIHLAYNCLIAFKAFGIYLISSLYIL